MGKFSIFVDTWVQKKGDGVHCAKRLVSGVTNSVEKKDVMWKRLHLSSVRKPNSVQYRVREKYVSRVSCIAIFLSRKMRYMSLQAAIENTATSVAKGVLNEFRW